MGSMDAIIASGQAQSPTRSAQAVDRRPSFRPVAPIDGSVRPVAGDHEELVASFKNVLAEALDAVNDLQINADRMTQQLATGEAKNLHDVLIAVEQVNIGLQLTMQIRNKVVEAYQEIMRMQV